jgi:phosphatidylglycerol:prolipoprotein diacylglycerol transferase
MPDGIQIGPIFIHFYGVIIMIGVVAAVLLSLREAKRLDENPEIAWDSVAWVLIGGIIGARIWHILTPPESMVEQGITTMYYLTHPLDALAIWNGGLGIPGAVIGGVLAFYIYARRRKVNFILWLDIIAPGLALAQAIGRWGNFVNQELYGSPTTLPWGIYIDPAHRLPGFAQYAYYQPLFLYESILDLINMGLLLWIGRRFIGWLKPGDTFLSYLLIYPAIRFFLEFLRLDPSQVLSIDINQWLMALVFVCSLAVLLWRHLRKRKITVTIS